MNQGNINLLIRSNIVTKEEICDIYQNMWKSPHGVLWFYEKYGPGSIFYNLRTKIAYPEISYNDYGQPAYTKDDYDWAQNLFSAEPPVPYDEATKQFLANLFPPKPDDDIDYLEYLRSRRETDPKFRQDCEKLSGLFDIIRNSNTSGHIDMDKIELIPSS